MTYILEALPWKSILSQPYIGWKRMKSPTTLKTKHPVTTVKKLPTYYHFIFTKYKTFTLLEGLKIRFQRFFTLRFSEVFHIKLHLISSGLNGLLSIHWHRLWHCCKFMCSIFGKSTKPFAFIKPNIIQKLAYKIKYISQTMNAFRKFESNIFFN